MGFLNGKRILVTGLISNRSIAFGIANALHKQGAKLAFSYQNERFEKRVCDMAKQWDSTLVFPCDVSSDEEIDDFFKTLKQHWDHFDGLIHAIAFAPKEQLEGNYMDHVSREGFKIAHDISSYSFAALGKAARPFMTKGGSLLTLSYIGSQRAMSPYNVMGIAKASLEANVRYMAQSLGPEGIRVNAISAGPIRTLAASGIAGFRQMLTHAEEVTPLRKNISTEEVGNAAAFLCSELASGITGHTLYVDAGYHAV